MKSIDLLKLIKLCEEFNIDLDSYNKELFKELKQSYNRIKYNSEKYNIELHSCRKWVDDSISPDETSPYYESLCPTYCPYRNNSIKYLYSGDYEGEINCGFRQALQRKKLRQMTAEFERTIKTLSIYDYERYLDSQGMTRVLEEFMKYYEDYIEMKENAKKL